MSETDRLARIETRLVQLMIWLGASPGQTNPPDGFVDKLKKELQDAPASEVDWAQFDRPAYLRRANQGE